MSYPQFPDNRLIVDGVDMCAKFGMVMADGYTLTPPTPKTYMVDIPGGNGKIDLTESLLGDVAYDNRKMEFIFYIIDIEDFEMIKTEISNYLHGKSFDYKITMDPEYTYHGRFTVTEYNHKAYSNVRKVGAIKISIDAKPFKHKKNQVYRIDAVGGTTVYLESSRERVRPKIETSGLLKVIYNGKLVRLPEGTWTVNDIIFKDGPNEIYFNSYDVKNLTWGDIKTNNITWNGFKEKRLYEWYKSNGDGTFVMAIWDDMTGNTWDDLANSKWNDLVYQPEKITSVSDVYIEYKVGDL